MPHLTDDSVVSRASAQHSGSTMTPPPETVVHPLGLPPRPAAKRRMPERPACLVDSNDLSAPHFGEDMLKREFEQFARRLEEWRARSVAKSEAAYRHEVAAAENGLLAQLRRQGIASHHMPSPSLCRAAGLRCLSVLGTRGRVVARSRSRRLCPGTASGGLTPLPIAGQQPATSTAVVAPQAQRPPSATPSVSSTGSSKVGTPTAPMPAVGSAGGAGSKAAARGTQDLIDMMTKNLAMFEQQPSKDTRQRTVRTWPLLGQA